MTQAMGLTQRSCTLSICALCIVLAAGCAPPAAPPPLTVGDLPAPPFTTESSSYGSASRARQDRVAHGTADVLREAFGDIGTGLGSQMLYLDTLDTGRPAAGWPEVEAFYDSAFARPPLAGLGFVRDTSWTDASAPNPVAVWTRRRGRGATDEAVGVAFVAPGTHGDDLAFVIRFATGDTRNPP